MLLDDFFANWLLPGAESAERLRVMHSALLFCSVLGAVRVLFIFFLLPGV